MYSNNSTGVNYYRGDDGKIYIITTYDSSASVEYERPNIPPIKLLETPKSFTPRSFFCYEKKNRVYVVCSRYLADATQTLNILADINNFDGNYLGAGSSGYSTQVYSIDEVKEAYQGYEVSAIPGYFWCFLLVKKRTRRIVL